MVTATRRCGEGKGKAKGSRSVPQKPMITFYSSVSQSVKHLWAKGRNEGAKLLAVACMMNTLQYTMMLHQIGPMASPCTQRWTLYLLARKNILFFLLFKNICKKSCPCSNWRPFFFGAPLTRFVKTLHGYVLVFVVVVVEGDFFSSGGVAITWACGTRFSRPWPLPQSIDIHRGPRPIPASPSTQMKASHP